MDYAKISQTSMKHIYQAYSSLEQSPLDPGIRVLVELRVSQINACQYCCKLHTKEARQLNIHQEKIDALKNWTSSSLFSKKECLALKLCEHMTQNIPQAKDTISALYEYFSEREIVDLGICISLMNALNRLAISFSKDEDE